MSDEPDYRGQVVKVGYTCLPAMGAALAFKVDHRQIMTQADHSPRRRHLPGGVSSFRLDQITMQVCDAVFFLRIKHIILHKFSISIFHKSCMFIYLANLDSFCQFGRFGPIWVSFQLICQLG